MIYINNQDLVETGKQVLSWENITTHGVLIGVIVLLVVYIRYLHKENNYLRDKCLSFTEKFFTLTTILNETMNDFKK